MNCNFVVGRDPDERTFIEYHFPFCPNCGARMDTKEGKP